MHGFQWTGHDDFADNDILSIVVEVPDDSELLESAATRRARQGRRPS
jgi:hypothetical protein